MTLRNGATVLASGVGVVLARTLDGEYVTWRVVSDGSTHGGHYFETLAEAEQDFDARCLVAA